MSASFGYESTKEVSHSNPAAAPENVASQLKIHQAPKLGEMKNAKTTPMWNLHVAKFARKEKIHLSHTVILPD